MIRLAAIAAFALTATACTTAQVATPVAYAPNGPDSCNAASLQAAVGQAASIMPTNLQALRIVDVKQGEPAYDAPQRVTVINDIQNQKVVAVRCG